ncbi:hypothetical protein ABZX12_16305 [Kribbella sp. NPDC003505]|uniref:hypothetical protein n=1 Tax=Kribbella sp. NPDC003505 TaxID=3154448 RepID=UPI0033A32BD2
MSFAAEVGEDLSGGCQGVLAGDAGWVQFIGVEVGEAGAEDRFEAGAGVGVRQIVGRADEVDEEGELTGCGLPVEQRQGFAGGEGVAGVEVRGDLADGGDEGGVVAGGPDGIDAWRNLVDAEPAEEVVEMVLGPGFRDTFLQLAATRFGEGFAGRLLGGALRAEKVGMLVEQRCQGLAVGDEGRCRTCRAGVFVELAERVDDRLAVEVEGAVPMGEAEHRAGGFDDVPVPRGPIGAGELAGCVSTRRQ